MICVSRLIVLLVVCVPISVLAQETTEFCLDGELDLGARYQGTTPSSGEFYPTTWCVITEDDSQRVMFSGAGRSNPDIDGSWTVVYSPPDNVRIVNRDAPPDVLFADTDNLVEAMRVRRVDPRRLIEDLQSAGGDLNDLLIETRDNRPVSANTTAILPLRGVVDVAWRWSWADPSKPSLRLMLDDLLLFKATGRWRTLSKEEATATWETTPGADPIEVPGDRWPARINMRLINLTDDVYLVRGVRTGFQHMVVETEKGLVVADAPSGWVEFHHLPPSDLVPGLGVSGLSEQFVDFLEKEFPDRPVHAVVLTHFHDDHSGGARAFAAAGASVYATEESAEFLETALNRDSHPADRLSNLQARLAVLPVSESAVIGDAPNRVRIMPIGQGPHAYAMLGVWAVDHDYFFVSDIHVPRSDDDFPREDRQVTECWFADWAVENLPAEVRVVNSHSPEVTPVSRLKRYLESEFCSESAPR